MVDKNDIKEKIRKIYEVLPNLDDQRCGYKTCGEFARAVADGKAPCYGCTSGGPEVAAKVCEIMGASVPSQAIPQFGPNSGLYEPGLTGLSGGRGIGQGIGRGRGMAHGRTIGRGFGQGRRGR